MVAAAHRGYETMSQIGLGQAAALAAAQTAGHPPSEFQELPRQELTGWGTATGVAGKACASTGPPGA